MTDPTNQQRPAPASIDPALQETHLLRAAGGRGRSGRQPIDVAVLDTSILPAVSGYRDALAASSVRDLTLREYDIAHLPTEPLIAVGAARRVPVAATGAALVGAALSMIAREGLLKIIVLCANVLLARLLAPQDFGIFTVLTFFNTFLATFATFGLAAAVVQREAAPSQVELASLTAVQVLIAGVVVVIAEAAAPLAATTYDLGPDGIWLVRSMALSFLLVSAAATPMALLERRLAFGRVAFIEVVAGVTYQAVAVALAYAGFGVWSLVCGTLGGSALTLLLAYPVAGWAPRLSWRWRSIRSLLGFGVRYQAVNVVALVKDATIPTFVAAALGTAAVGYIDWAATLAFYPLILVAIIGRVTFPAYARLAREPDRLQVVIEATIRAQAYVIYPAVAILAALAPFITVLVFGAKWLPAVPLIDLLLVSTVAASVSSALVAALNALGKPQVVLRFMLMWLILGWATTVGFVLWLGMVGYAVANALVAATVIVVVVVFRRYQPVRVLRNVALPLVAAALVGAGLYALSQSEPPTTLWELATDVAAAFAAFALVEVIVDGAFRRDVRAILRMALRRRRGARIGAAR